jgi:hypothetical protein
MMKEGTNLTAALAVKRAAEEQEAAAEAKKRAAEREAEERRARERAAKELRRKEERCVRAWCCGGWVCHVVRPRHGGVGVWSVAAACRRKRLAEEQERELRRKEEEREQALREEEGRRREAEERAEVLRLGLFAAARGGRKEALTALLEGRTDAAQLLALRDDGATLLHACLSDVVGEEETGVAARRVEIAAVLLALDAQSGFVVDMVTARDKAGRALVHACAEAGDAAYLRLLVEHKARHPGWKLDLNGEWPHTPDRTHDLRVVCPEA